MASEIDRAAQANRLLHGSLRNEHVLAGMTERRSLIVVRVRRGITGRSLVSIVSQIAIILAVVVVTSVSTSVGVVVAITAAIVSNGAVPLTVTSGLTTTPVSTVTPTMPGLGIGGTEHQSEHRDEHGHRC